MSILHTLCDFGMVRKLNTNKCGQDGEGGKEGTANCCSKSSKSREKTLQLETQPGN